MNEDYYNASCRNIEAMHQKVREYIEKYLEDRNIAMKVVSIESCSITRYVPTIETKQDLIPQYILASTDIASFSVAAMQPHSTRDFHCKVYVLCDGSFLMNNISTGV